MKTLLDQLSQYAGYHRDRRNVATHFIGIPMIVVAVATLLARPSLEVAGMTVAPATIVVLMSTAYYLRLDPRFGLVMAVLLALSLWVAQICAASSTTIWLTTGVGLFVVGWAFQFVGHHYEGRKPAFVDDLMGLIVGPLFVVAELAFMLGLRRDLQHAIEVRVGAVKGSGAAQAA